MTFEARQQSQRPTFKSTWTATSDADPFSAEDDLSPDASLGDFATSNASDGDQSHHAFVVARARRTKPNGVKRLAPFELEMVRSAFDACGGKCQLG